MSGVSRFLSVSKRDKEKDKDKHKHHSLSAHLAGHARSSNNTSSTTLDKPPEAIDPTSPVDFYGLFFDKSKPADKDEEAKVKQMRTHIVGSKGVMLKDGQILWALRSQASKGDVNGACELLVAMSDASEGIVTPFSPKTKLRGAVNRHAVTCYLDSTLFSMFSRLDSFEAMLYNSFDDVPRQRLAFLLRLWVNLLRSGDLVAVDVTKEIQQSLAECGWRDAKELHQQDASEAFTFITEKLNLPLLTLKMDIYHTGRQDNDDHKFINERLLEVAIPTLPNGEHPTEMRLEDCLEEYFNNRIEVKRYLERRSTLTSLRASDSRSKGGTSVHVEAIEIDPEGSLPGTPVSPIPSYMNERPANRHRAPSIIQERYIPDDEKLSLSQSNDSRRTGGRSRTGSVRKEVLMPAWQFFSLIPWYTDHAPSSDAQVADHFSSKRPVLGLCLKRYSYTNAGRAIRLSTFVDIPLEIGLPHFIQDDNMDETGPLFGNFKLSLQSAVCHRGSSVDSGHYISLVRSTPPDVQNEKSESSYWLRFDDLASPRVSLIDIHKALREETPYLLFYQILPVEGDPGNLTSGEQLAPPEYASLSLDSSTATPDTMSAAQTPMEPLAAVFTNDSRPGTRSSRASFDMSDMRGRSTDVLSARRPSAISFNEPNIQPSRDQSILAVTGVGEHKKTGSLSKTLSKLGLRDRRKSGDEISPSTSPPLLTPAQLSRHPSQHQPLQQSNVTNISAYAEQQQQQRPEIHVDEVSVLTPEQTQAPARTLPLTATPATTTDNARQRTEPGSLAIALQNANAGNGLGRSRSKRSKSRNRLHKSSGKDKDKDPDRECLVM